VPRNIPRLLLLLALPAIFAASCSHEKQVKVSGALPMRAVETVTKWGQSNGLEEFDCGKYWAKDDLPIKCLRSASEYNKLPQIVVYVSRLQQKSFVNIGVIENPNMSEHGESIFIDLVKSLKLAQGSDHVEIKN
jgi:hypothetical protein